MGVNWISIRDKKPSPTQHVWVTDGQRVTQETYWREFISLGYVTHWADATFPEPPEPTFADAAVERLRDFIRRFEAGEIKPTHTWEGGCGCIIGEPERVQKTFGITYEEIT